MACDKVCLSVVSISGILEADYDESQSSLVDETLEEGIYDNLVSFGGSVFRQIRGIQRKPFAPFF